jgi:hypothetical protein
MALQYKLSGDLIECCDCFTICPCWVAEIPDEEHCSALYVWHFAAGSTIEGRDIGGRTVVAATYHGRRRSSQSAIYVDDTIVDEATRNALILAFSGKGGGSLADISSLTGSTIDAGAAKITVSFAVGEWSVHVEAKAALLASCVGSDREFDGQTGPVSVEKTALHTKLGVKGAVDIQDVSEFQIALSPLPSGPFVFSGRSGMRGTFAYSSPREGTAPRNRSNARDLK